MNLMVATTFRWLSMTPRGCPVLPDVYWRNARSSSPGSAVCPREAGGVASAHGPEPPVRDRFSVEVKVRLVGCERGTPAHHLGQRRRRVHVLVGHPWLLTRRARLRSHAEGRGHSVRVVVAEVQDLDAVAGLPRPHLATEGLEAVDDHPRDADEHVARAEPRARYPDT